MIKSNVFSSNRSLVILLIQLLLLFSNLFGNQVHQRSPCIWICNIFGDALEELVQLIDDNTGDLCVVADHEQVIFMLLRWPICFMWIFKTYLIHQVCCVSQLALIRISRLIQRIILVQVLLEYFFFFLLYSILPIQFVHTKAFNFIFFNHYIYFTQVGCFFFLVLEVVLAVVSFFLLILFFFILT